MMPRFCPKGRRAENSIDGIAPALLPLSQHWCWEQAAILVLFLNDILPLLLMQHLPCCFSRLFIIHSNNGLAHGIKKIIWKGHGYRQSH